MFVKICIVIFRNYSKTEFSSSTIAPGKSGNKKFEVKEEI